MAEPSQALRTSLAGRYDVERELGEGGMATIYLADDVGLIDAGVVGDDTSGLQPFYVMPLINGETLEPCADDARARPRGSHLYARVCAALSDVLRFTRRSALPASHRENWSRRAKTRSIEIRS